MTSSLLCGRLCIIIAVVILLFLSLTFSANNNDALAQPVPPGLQPGQPGPQSDPNWHYKACVKAYTEYNQWASANGFPPKDFDCSFLLQMAEPLDCNQLQTCPDPCAGVVPTSLDSHDSHSQSEILFVDYVYVQQESQNICPAKPYDWNEWKRDRCRDLHEGFYFIACDIAGYVLSDRWVDKCEELRVREKNQCNLEYPPDRHSYPEPQPGLDPTYCILFPRYCEA
jgi:hypothetical protein